MTVMETKSEQPESSGQPAEIRESAPATEQKPAAEKKAEKAFSDANLTKSSEIELGGDGKTRKLTVTAADKVAFVDAICGNTRFTKTYSLFGGKVSLRLRALTTDEVNALAAWTVKCGAQDSAGLLSGRYRKYLAAAQVAMLNGEEMPVLEQPLFETLQSDGKTVQKPAWIARCDRWDNVSTGLFDAIMCCIVAFNELYAALCRKAEDENFWNPDTH